MPLSRFGAWVTPPPGWDELTKHLTRKGYTKDHLLRAGLLTERDDGDTYDKFRNRLMFPIRDTYGKMTGFGGRVLNPDDVPKYLNSRVPNYLIKVVCSTVWTWRARRSAKQSTRSLLRATWMSSGCTRLVSATPFPRWARH